MKKKEIKNYVIFLYALSIDCMWQLLAIGYGIYSIFFGSVLERFRCYLHLYENEDDNVKDNKNIRALNCLIIVIYSRIISVRSKFMKCFSAKISGKKTIRNIPPICEHLKINIIRNCITTEYVSTSINYKSVQCDAGYLTIP